ncbi:hypothetical protein M0R45_000182 [Rubus argutus]|uniref:Uncharacterized protein n=1 Tax=Rubus argutus TaxID=59490 RepID=A0AAW1VNE6_RUBAR
MIDPDEITTRPKVAKIYESYEEDHEIERNAPGLEEFPVLNFKTTQIHLEPVLNYCTSPPPQALPSSQTIIDASVAPSILSGHTSSAKHHLDHHLQLVATSPASSQTSSSSRRRPLLRHQPLNPELLCLLAVGNPSEQGPAQIRCQSPAGFNNHRRRSGRAHLTLPANPNHRKAQPGNIQSSSVADVIPPSLSLM